MADLTTIKANIAKAQGAIERLNAVYVAKGRLSPKQNASFTTWRDKLVRFQREEAAWHAAHPSVPELDPVALGPDPIPNNSVFDGNTYDAEMTLEEFEQKYGRSPEQVYSEIATGLLRPRLPYTPFEITAQKVMLDYFAGKVGFVVASSYFGGWYKNLGLVDVTKIHDLGAA